jgi:hypothetical protein
MNAPQATTPEGGRFEPFGPYAHGLLKQGNVPDTLFVLALRDDALAPEFSCGTAVVWSKTRQPRPGRLVLVRDKYGRDHVRVYHDGRAPGQWSAVARNPAFPTFDAVEDGLQILAVHRGVLDAEDVRPEGRRKRAAAATASSGHPNQRTRATANAASLKRSI